MKSMIFSFLFFFLLCNSSTNNKPNYVPSKSESFTAPKSPFISENQSSRMDNYNFASKNDTQIDPKSPFVTTKSDDTVVEFMIRETQKQESDEESSEIPRENDHQIIAVKSKRKQKKINAHKKIHSLDDNNDTHKMDTTTLFHTSETSPYPYSSKSMYSEYHYVTSDNSNFAKDRIIPYEYKEKLNCKKGCRKLAKILGFPVVVILKFPDFISFITWLVLNFEINPIHCSNDNSNTANCQALQIATETFKWTAIVTFFIRIFILLTKYFHKKTQNN